MQKPLRYHPLMVTMHWLVALLTFLNLYLGLIAFHSRNLPQSLGLHMIAGILLLLLIIVRFIARLILPRPADVSAGNPLLDFIGKLVHYSLYFFLALITIVGLIFSLRSGELQYSFLQNTALAGLNFSAISAGFLGISWITIHHFLAYVLAALITLHVLAALYHQFSLKDRLLSRMWYGKR